MNDTDKGVFAAGEPVLVTGATGFSGSVLVRKLCERGARVRAIARSSSNRDSLQGLPVEWHLGDVFDPAVIARAMVGTKYVFHVAAAYRQAGLTDEVYRQVHVESTQRLAEAAVKTPGFKRFVHVSTVGVHGHVERPPADEKYPFYPGDIYQRTKADAELWIREFASKSGLPVTVIRPAAIYGPGDRRLLKVFKMAEWPVCLVPGRSSGPLYHLIHVDDLTEVLILAAIHPRASGEVFICGDPAALSLAGILGIVGSEYGRKVRILRVPVWPLFLAAAICETACRPFGIAPPIYRRRVAFFTKDRSFNTAKLRERLGYVYRRTTEQGLRETARWYRDHGWVKVR